MEIVPLLLTEVNSLHVRFMKQLIEALSYVAVIYSALNPSRPVASRKLTNLLQSILRFCCFSF